MTEDAQTIYAEDDRALKPSLYLLKLFLLFVFWECAFQDRSRVQLMSNSLMRLYVLCR